MDQEDNCATSCCINGFTKPTIIFSSQVQATGVIRAAFEADLKNREWIESHHAYLASQFADSYVAVREGKVLAFAGTIPALRERIDTSALFPQACSPDITITFVSSKPVAMIL